MTKIKVLKPFTSSGRCYNANQIYEVEDGHARDHIAGGLVKKAEADAASTTKSTTKSTAKSTAKAPAKKK
jgi:hypothetical protein